MKRLLIGSIAIFLMTGCSGMELGGKLWAARVDEMQSSQRTYRNHKPLKCYLWATCPDQTEEVQGS